MSRFLYIIGARPQFIKMAAINRAASQEKRHEQLILHTGQHYDSNMSDVFFEELGIPKPDHNLGVAGLPHGAMTGRMMEGIEEVILGEKPDWVVVFGDTNSTLAGALAAVKQHVPCAHVEAGLRSYNRKMPEEINRVLADHCADLLLTPTANATKHLLGEGVPERRIREVGDVMHDVALHYRERVLRDRSLATFGLQEKKYVLATVHRAENSDDPARLRAILDGLIDVAKRYPVVCPLHPRTRAMLDKHGWLEEASSALMLIDPVGYLDMVLLENGAVAIITDSGGVQKEAYFFQVPCLVLRDQTEWVELIEHGFHRLVRVKEESMADCLESALKGIYNWDHSLYGEGRSGATIIEALLNYG